MIVGGGGTGMVIYAVEAVVDGALCEAYERYMTSRHIEEVLATGRFKSASFETGEPGRYRACYRADDHVELDRYFAENAETLRADFISHFPNGVEVTRAVWTLIKHFP